MRGVVTALAATCITWGAVAQTFPVKPIRLLVGYPPGGPIDVAGRILAPRMFEGSGFNVIVDNRDGANGIIAAGLVARAAPDGYTLYLGTAGNLSVNPALYRKLPFDVTRDFTPLSHIVSVSSLLYVHPSLDVRTLSELIGYARAHPGKLNFSSSGNGGLPHLSGELFNMLAGVKTVHVPYKGTAPAFNALLANEVQFAFSAVVSGLQHVRSGRLRAIATTTRARLAMLPDVPPASETIPGFEVDNWYGLVLPARVPADIVAQLHREIVRVLGLREVREKLLAQAWEPVGTTPASFAAFMRSEQARWARVIQEANVRPE